MDKQLAKIALELIATTRVQGDDVSLHGVLQTRQWLRDIITGRLVVTTAVPPEEPTMPSPSPAAKPTKVSKLPAPAVK